MTTHHNEDAQHPNAERKAWLSVLAKAPAPLMADHWADAGFDPHYSVLRAPEIGTVMVRGRAGAVGAPFNMGEMTVTRASVRLASGVVGHGYVQGRDKTQAVQAALSDALLQTDQRAQVQMAVIKPLQEAADALRTQRAAKAAATKVDFFTLARGED